MTKALKITGWTAMTVLGLIAIGYIGIPSRLISTNVDKKIILNIKEVNKILVKAQLQLPRSEQIADFPQLLPDEYGYITQSKQVDKLFNFLSANDRSKIKSLFDSGELKMLDMNRLGCIRYTIKSSLLNYVINSSWETVYLQFSNCNCHCEEMELESDDKVTKQSLENGWIKLDVVTFRKPIQC